MTARRSPPSSNSAARWTAVVVTVLLAIFASLAWRAVGNKSSTFDEPVHALSARAIAESSDFRLNPEHPPLWKRWMALGQRPETVSIDYRSAGWNGLLDDSNSQWDWTVQTLYRTPGNDGERLVRQSRAMMLILGIAVGGAIAIWTYRFGGAIGSIFATALFAFDPNFLGHSPLATNDVAATLLFVGLCYCLWRIGERASIGWIAAAGLCLGAALGVKFTALLFVPIVGLMLLIRAAWPTPWIVLRWRLNVRSRRLFGALCVYVMIAICAWATLWAAYGFRGSTTPLAGEHHNFDRVTLEIAIRRAMAHQGSETPLPSREKVERERNGLPVRLATMFQTTGLLPQSWLYGLLFTYMTTRYNPSFLLGLVRPTGWWFYFPIAMLVKMPLATLIAIGGGLGVARLRRRRNKAITDRSAEETSRAWRTRWFMLSLVVPPACFLALSMTSSFNVGLRHALPVYPALFIGVGVAGAWAVRRWGRLAIGAMIGIVSLLAIESLWTFPNYIAFFNVLVGGERGGRYVLGDSNLDWGQDLPLLAEWQRDHREVRLYLSYFGTADPAAYGIVYSNLAPGYDYGPPSAWPTEEGVIAISATNLQGIYQSPQNRATILVLIGGRKLRGVLGGTIYLYEFP